jgi:hypothetical protein
MILGRTPGGAIKTKSDGGLRAVNCACCGCGCYSISIPSALRPLFENANISNLSAFGVSSAFFGYLKAEFSGGIANDLWYADFTYNLGDNYLGMGFYYQKSTGCLTMGNASPNYFDIEGYTPGDFYDYPEGFLPEVVSDNCSYLGYLGSFVGAPASCIDPEFSPFPQEDTFTINGEGSFPFWYEGFSSFFPFPPCFGGSFPPPNIAIT